MPSGPERSDCLFIVLVKNFTVYRISFYKKFRNSPSYFGFSLIRAKIDLLERAELTIQGPDKKNRFKQSEDCLTSLDPETKPLDRKILSFVPGKSRPWGPLKREGPLFCAARESSRKLTVPLVMVKMSIWPKSQKPRL